MRQAVSLVVFDLDNTLWDWLAIWHASFSAMLERIVTDSGIDSAILKPQFKAIHQTHGTAEYPFSVEELPALRAKHPGGDLRSLYDAAVQAAHRAREPLLKPYPNVRETLETLKDMKCLLVGYTESMASYAAFRLRRTGLDQFLDFLYSPADHDLPRNLSEEQRATHRRAYQLRRTVHRHTPKGALKPNPKVLLDIIREVGAVPEHSIYVGDSECKDIATASAAGVTDVWAKYGLASADESAYTLFKEVTHWPDADVAVAECAIDQRTEDERIRPSHVLDEGLNQLLELFDFVPFDGATSGKSGARVKDRRFAAGVQSRR